MSSNQNAAQAHTAQPVELSKIHVDYNWNGRAARNVQDIQDTESSGFKGFLDNIRAAGQDEPVILRNTDGKTITGQKTDKPFELLVGFRRYRAIELANQENTNKKQPAVLNLPNGTILATVRNINDQVEARLLNARENTARKNLKAPDLVFIARDLGDKGLIQAQIADALQITQGWVSKLLAIAKLPPAVLAHWRDSTPIPAVQTKDGVFELKAPQGSKVAETTRQATEPEMRALSELKKDNSPEELTARYIQLIAPPPAPGEGPGAPSEKDKIREDVREIGALIGCLVRAGVLENGTLDWGLVIGPKKEGYPIDSGKIKADERRQRILDLVDAITEAFEAEVSKPAKGKSA